MRTTPSTPVHGTALVLLTAALLGSALGCGSGGGEPKSSGTRSSADSGSTAGAAGEPGGTSQGAKRSGQANIVLLTEKGCVQFEPHWATIGVGQSLTWKSELKNSVTIHVSPGAFARTQYVVRAGASVSTGPARVSGSFSISTEPAACQGVPRGVQGSGPGLTVEGAAQP